MSVNVYTEWGPLREIIIGNSMNFNIEGFDEIFKLLYRDNISKTLVKAKKEEKRYRIQKKYCIERQDDLDNFANILKDMGIKVKRPKKLDRIIATRTPHFKALINAADSPRDMFMCLGNEIIETPPTNRNRYFEGMMFFHIFLDYFRKGAKWTLGPRTRLIGDSMDRTHWTKAKKLHNLEEIENCFDISFDAANCLKFGKDILMNVGNKNHELGMMWLQRHLGDEFRVHPVRLCDYHIDGKLMPLKPGTLLVSSWLKKNTNLLPKPLQKWKMIEAPEDETKNFIYPNDHIQLASFSGMAINVLSIDEKTICVRAEDKKLHSVLEKEGFELIKIQLRHCELFGGGLHCSTLDVNRDESMKDYWY